MPASERSRPEVPPSRLELEEQLLQELKQAEAAFHAAKPEEKEAAGQRYREALDRFNNLIVHRKAPGTSESS
jgi:hypothetical protein